MHKPLHQCPALPKLVAVVHSTWRLRVGRQKSSPSTISQACGPEPGTQEVSKTKPNSNNKRKVPNGPSCQQLPTSTSSTPRGLIFVAINYSELLGLRHENPFELPWVSDGVWSWDLSIEPSLYTHRTLTMCQVQCKESSVKRAALSQRHAFSRLLQCRLCTTCGRPRLVSQVGARGWCGPGSCSIWAKNWKNYIYKSQTSHVICDSCQSVPEISNLRRRFPG